MREEINKRRTPTVIEKAINRLKNPYIKTALSLILTINFQLLFKCQTPIFAAHKNFENPIILCN